PAGLAFETETRAQQLDRERRGERRPPVTILVANRGNNVVRRVREDGQVETLRSDSGAALKTAGVKALPGGSREEAGLVTRFRLPTGIAVDSAGNIYVTEPDSSQLRTILRNG